MEAKTLTDSARWPLVGREAELAAIATAREAPGCSGVVVTAAAGMGKSRLAREAQAAAGRDGALTDWVQATRSAASVPLGAFAGLLPDEVRADDPLELMRRSAEELRERAAGRPIVIAVDDAQLLDPVSATLVLHLAATGSAFVLATVRAGEPCPDAIVSLWKDAGARRMELGSLDEHAVARLIEAVLEAPVEQFALGRAAYHSQGNPMYVRELVLSALDDGVLRLQRGMWRIATRSTRLSRTLIELVTQRMSGLSEQERELLELLALGEPLRIAEAAALSDGAALSVTEAKGLVTATLDNGGQVRLAHPIYGDALQAELPIVRARHLRLRLVEALRSRSPMTADDALRVARLSLDAGADVPGEVLIDAARAATLTGDPTLGAELAERAVAAGRGLPALLLLARAHTVRKRFQDAEATLAAAEDLATADDAGLDYLEQRTHVLFWGLNRVEETSALLERARSWSDDPGWSKRMEPLRLRFTTEIADSVQALTDVLADEALDPATRLRGERRLAVSLFYTGRVGEARALAAGVLPSIPLGDYSDALALGAWRLIEFETAEDWPALDAYMARVLREAVHARDNEAAGHGALDSATRRTSAAATATRGAGSPRRRPTSSARTRSATCCTCGRCASGRSTSAATTRRRWRRTTLLLETLAGNQPLFSQTSFIARAEGWALRARGDLDRRAPLLPRLRRGARHDARLRRAARLRGAAGGRGPFYRGGAARRAGRAL